MVERDKKQVGIFGGTFDPLHIGHLIAAETAKTAAALDEIWFMPTYQPPHKSTTPAATPEQRREMIILAIREVPYFQLCDLEIEEQTSSYTADTMEKLFTKFPEVQFSFILGADMALDLPKWYRSDFLRAQLRFVALNRPGYQLTLETLPVDWQQRVQLAEMPDIGFSSTNIRDRLAEGLSARFMVPDQVYTYIEGNGCYSKGAQRNA